MTFSEILNIQISYRKPAVSVSTSCTVIEFHTFIPHVQLRGFLSSHFSARPPGSLNEINLSFVPKIMCEVTRVVRVSFFRKRKMRTRAVLNYGHTNALAPWCRGKIAPKSKWQKYKDPFCDIPQYSKGLPEIYWEMLGLEFLLDFLFF